MNIPKTPIAIWGASGHAMAVSNAVSLCGQYEIIGYLDNINPNRKGEIFNGTPVLGGLEALAFLLGLTVNYVILVVWVFNRWAIENRKAELTIFGSIGIPDWGRDTIRR